MGQTTTTKITYATLSGEGLDEVHGALDAAIDSLYRLSTVLEDELAGGASLEQAGQAITQGQFLELSIG